ncbi:Imm51 family immunity protein [Catellatospora sp. KI3]|uniref:Imm51 family immunity protein n=1 Tax=Catellatospora sp. KI3 TaxID=3041620 RepID=UPI002482FA2B|nr:Imm51 family immunity protein [Catellatospora sp. KI3]MDI1464577.1 Imm51 family immunity protein [Catellatospora sp. KI3]
MTPLKLIETDAGKYSLLLNAGGTGVDEVVYELGHEPSGYFWAGVARLIVEHEAPGLAGRFAYDPEAGMFCAYGTDRAALAELGELMSGPATGADRVRALVALAAATGFEFDD